LVAKVLRVVLKSTLSEDEYFDNLSKSII